MPFDFGGGTGATNGTQPRFDFTDGTKKNSTTKKNTAKKNEVKKSSMADFRQLEEKQSGNNLAPTGYKESPKTLYMKNVALGNPETPTLNKILSPVPTAIESITQLLPQSVRNWGNRASQSGGEVVTLLDNPDKVDTGSTAGNLSADLLGALAGFVANPTPGSAGNLGANSWKLGEQAIERLLPKVTPNASKLAQTALKMGGATVPFEAGRALANDRPVDPVEMGTAAGANMLIGALTHGLGKLSKGDKKVETETKVEEPDDVFDFSDFTDIPTAKADFTVEPTGRTHVGEPQLELGTGRQAPLALESGERQALPAGQQSLALREGYTPDWETPTPYETAMALERQKPKALTSSGEPLALKQGVDWEYKQPADFTVDSSGKAMAKDTAYPPAKVEGVDYSTNTGLGDKQRILTDESKTIPRSDVGDPAYLATQEKRYNDMVNEEVAKLKEGTGNAPAQGSLVFDNEGNVVNRLGRVSNNDSWYQDFYAQNGRPPREGEYRDIAIKNLLEGNASTGEPANAEFNAILSELSRGQKLPEEWHGLQKSIKETGDTPELQGLASDMKAEQAKVEPYGLTKNLDRLTEIENAARGRAKDYIDFRAQYPDAVGAVDKSFDFVKDLTIIGATKIAKGAITFEQWSKEMIAEYGQDIASKLSYIWNMSSKLAEKGEIKIKYNGELVPIKLEALEPPIKGANVADKAINQPDIENATVGQPEATTGVLNEIGINPNELKDISGLQAGWRDIWRNMKTVFGDKYEAVKAKVLDPLEDAKANWVDHQRQLTDDLYTDIVDGLGIKKDSKESELVQLYGEGGYHFYQPAPKATLNEKTGEVAKNKFITDLEKQYGKGNVEWAGDGADILKPYDYNNLVKDVGEDRAAELVQAENWFREKYDTLIDQVNEVRAQIYPNNPDKLIPKRKDYFRHFREMEGIEGIQNLFDTSAQIPADLAGKSMYTRPKSKYAGFMQKRGAGKYKADAVGGFLDYVPSATYSIHIDPQGAAFRQLEKELVDTMGDNSGINKFLEYIKYYADDLQGKTNFFDRSWQFLTDRKVFTGLNQLNGRIKGNMVLGNAGTMVSQVFNMPQGIAFTKQYSAPGLTRYIASAAQRFAKPEVYAKNNPMAQSKFLKERFSGDMYRRFDTKASAKAKNVAVLGMEDVDRFATEYIWNSCYEKGLNTKVADPIRYADANTRRLVAGRGIGEVPLLQKSKIVQMIAPFQVEVGNLWNVIGDMKTDKDVAGLVTLPLALWLFNKGSEKVKGSSVAFDPLQAVIDGIQIAQDGDDSKAWRIAGRMAGEVLSNVPLGQTVANQLPLTDSQRKEFFGREDPSRYGTGILVAKGAADPVFKIAMPWGGSQIEKTLKGAVALSEGGSYSDTGKLRYPVSPDPVNAIKGLTFGTSGLRESAPYYRNNGKVLSDKQTEQYKKDVAQGKDGQQSYDAIQQKRKINSLNAKIKAIRNDKKLNGEEKREKLIPLEKELRGLKAGR